MRPIVLALFLILPATAGSPIAQSALPATEVYVAPVTVTGDSFTIGKPENISNNPGYDNQPFFSPDGSSLYFTSERQGSGGATQTDIYRHDFTSGRLTQITRTPESEYSPTVVPGGRHLSVVRVEADGTQRLWRFTLDGQNPAVILENIKPVGYHAWLDADTLALFVLGQPATLQVAGVRSGKAEIAATNIGPSVLRMPSGGASFVQQAGEGSSRTTTISQVTVDKGKPVIRGLTQPVAGASQVHLAWTPDGALLMAHGGSLHAWRAGEPGWRAVADLERLGLKGVTRLAVSPKGDRIALIAQ